MMSKTRRQVLRSAGTCAGLLAFEALLSPALVVAQDICRRPRLGLTICIELNGASLCVAPPSRIAHLNQASTPPPAAFLSWEERRLIPESRIAGFDAALKSNVLQALSIFFGVNPRFGYYDEDRHDGRTNAVASDDYRAGNMRGTVLFGLKLLHRMLAADDGDYAAMAVCAHEFAHIKQFQGDIQERIASELPCYCIELHADFLAGFFIRRFKAGFGTANLQRIGQVWESWETATCTHGSRAQRIEAIEEGFRFGDPDRKHTVEIAVKDGLEYLRRYI